jgi:hypothetical protein
MKTIPLPLALAALGLAACGNDTAPTSSCNLVASRMYCQEYSNFSRGTIGAYRDVCTSSGGTWSESTCTRLESVGGCRTEDTIGAITNWFYVGGPYTAATGAAACESTGDTFVTP